MPDSTHTGPPDTVRIGDVLVELPALAELRHACDPALCAGRRSCCAEYEVRVDEAEVSRIAGLIPVASTYAALLTYDGQPENVFDGLGHGVCALETDEDGVCAFAYERSDGAVLCSLHAAAVDVGLDPYSAKPEACAMWPLAVVETGPAVLSVQPGAYRFPCNTRRALAGRELDAGVRQIVEALFGADFARELDEAVRRWTACER